MTVPSHRVRLVPYGPAAEQAVSSALRDLKGNDPLAPVTVVVPSPYVGLSLRRTLPAVGGPLLNVRFASLAEVAELLAATTLAKSGRRRLSPVVRFAAVRAVLAESPGEFAAVAGNLATERTLDRVFSELAGISPEARARVAHASPRAGHVVRLFDSFTARTAPWYSPNDTVDAAVEALGRNVAPIGDVGAVLLYLPGRLSEREVPFLRALADATGCVQAIIGVAGDAAADEEARNVAEVLSSTLGAPTEAPERVSPANGATGMLLSRAPDPSEEVRSAARWLLGLAEQGVPIHRTAILYRHAEPYALLTHEALAAAGIAHNGRRPQTLAQTVTGRTLLGLLDLPASEFRRSDLMAWLAAAPILERPGGPRAPVSVWDGLAKDAGVVGGMSQWQHRLRFAEEERERRGRERAAATANGDRAEVDEGWKRRVEQSQRLRQFVTELADRTLPERVATWADLVTWAKGSLRRYLGGGGAARSWPDDTPDDTADDTADDMADDHAAVVAAVEALAGLDAVGAVPTAAAFRRAVEQQLAAGTGRVGRFGEGIFLGSLADARGMSFDAVAIVGMAEGRFPPRHDESALLPDHVRVLTNGGLPSAAQRRAAERRDYLAAVASAPRRRLSWPAADPRGQRAEAPSRWLLDAAASLRGAPVTAADLQEHGPEPWFEAIPSAQAAITNGVLPMSVAERRLQVLTRWVQGGGAIHDHPVARADTAITLGVAAVRARGGDGFTAWDGLVGHAGRSLDEELSVSPTALETWATCPFRYFLSRVLRVQSADDPDEVDAISPLDRGRLVHEVLEQLVSEGLVPSRPDERWGAAARMRVVEIAGERGDRYERGGRTGSPLRWRLERERIRRELLQVLDLDDAYRAATGVVPEEVEMAFGADAGTPVTLRLPSGRTIGFHGFVDRVDRSPDGSRLVVTDYKTGGGYDDRGLESDPVARGTLLQLPVYGLAAKAKFGGDAVRTGYWFVSERAGFQRRDYELDDTVVQRLAEVVDVICGGVADGVFPARPGEEDLRPGMVPSYDNCRYCDYDRLCVADRGDAWDRKRHTPEVAGYVALAEGPGPGDEPAEVEP